MGAGQWQSAAAGTVESHESYLQNVTKEAEEEIGLVGVEFTEVEKRYGATPDGKFGRVIMFYAAVCDQPLEYFKPEEGTVERLAWINKDVLLDDVDAHPKAYVSSAAVWRDVYSS